MKLEGISPVKQPGQLPAGVLEEAYGLRNEKVWEALMTMEMLGRSPKACHKLDFVQFISPRHKNLTDVIESQRSLQLYGRESNSGSRGIQGRSLCLQSIHE